MAILNGHPGPRCLNKYITTYILNGREPDFRTLEKDEIQRADVRAVIKQIEDATPESIDDVFNETMSVLQETGYSQVLTFSNKSQAVTALKGHFLLYRLMAPINQFVEGLKLHDVLKLLRQHTEEAMKYFCEDLDQKSVDVVMFFKPSFSCVAEEKSIEEVIIYNWNKFLQNIEKGKVTSPWINIEDGTEKDVTLNIGHVLQALLGCTRIPLNIDCGVIEFDHSSLHFPMVNTCAPSITFSKTKDLQNYDVFVEIMMNIIVCSYGFGSA